MGKNSPLSSAKIGEQAPAGDLLVQNTHRKLRLVLDQAEMLSQRYQVVVANPPYMGLEADELQPQAIRRRELYARKAKISSGFSLNSV